MKENIVRNLSGVYVFRIILKPALYILFGYFTVLILSPVMLGMTSSLNWGLPFQIWNLSDNIMPFLLVLFTACLIFMVVDHGCNYCVVLLFVIGSSVLMLLFQVIEDINPGMIHGRVELIPGGWELFILLLTVLITSLFGQYVARRLSVFIHSNKPDVNVIQIIVSGLFGLIPVFVYGEMLGKQLGGI